MGRRKTDKKTVSFRLGDFAQGVLKELVGILGKNKSEVIEKLILRFNEVENPSLLLDKDFEDRIRLLVENEIKSSLQEQIKIEVHRQITKARTENKKDPSNESTSLIDPSERPAQ